MPEHICKLGTIPGACKSWEAFQCIQYADSGHPGMDPKILYGRNYPLPLYEGKTKADNAADQLVIAKLCSAALLLLHSTAHTVAIAL